MIPMLIDGKLVELTVEQYNQRMRSLSYGIKTDSEGRILGYKQPEYEIQDPNYPDDPTKKVVVNDLDLIKINGQEFRGIGYQGLMTVNTKTYVTEPTRSNDGSIANINDYETFVVPRCKVNFKYFSLDDYMRLCEAIQSNEFIVEYYDKQFNARVSHLMYCEPEEMVKLFNVGTSIIGVLDYEISFIGTLNPLHEYNLQYLPEYDISKDEYDDRIVNFKEIYNETSRYTKGDRVRWLSDNNYYEATFEKNTFNKTTETDSEPPNTKYWVAVTPTEWSYSKTYNLQDFVYETYQENGVVKYRYYECLKNGVSGFSLTNTVYWKSVAVSKYSDTKTYTVGDYCYKGTGITPSENSFYRAIYINDEFTGQSPDKSAYWKMIPVLSPQKVAWGASVVIIDQDELFKPPSETSTSLDKWKINSTNNYYVPNQSINVFRDLKLYAEWTKEV